MLSNVMNAVIDRYRPNISLSAAFDEQIVQEIRQDPTVAKAIKAMLTGGLTTRQTSHIYDGEVHLNLFSDRGWTAGLIRPHIANAMAYSNPGAAAIILVYGGNQESITRYAAKNLRRSLLSVASKASLGEKETIPVALWQVPHLACDDYIYYLNVTNGDAVWLRVSGPAECSYTHGFDISTGRYCYTTFSEVENTQNDFLSRVFKELSSSTTFNIHQNAETQKALVSACELLLADNHTTPPSQWRLVQTLSQIAPKRAKSVLALLSNEPGELQAPAQRALNSVKAHADAR